MPSSHSHARRMARYPSSAIFASLPAAEPGAIEAGLLEVNRHAAADAVHLELLPAQSAYKSPPRMIGSLWRFFISFPVTYVRNSGLPPRLRIGSTAAVEDSGSRG